MLRIHIRASDKKCSLGEHAPMPSYSVWSMPKSFVQVLLTRINLRELATLVQAGMRLWWKELVLTSPSESTAVPVIYAPKWLGSVCASYHMFSS